MLSQKKKLRIRFLIASAVMLIAATALVGYSLRSGISYFRSPTELVENPPGPTERFRIGGLVGVGSVARDSGSTIRFEITDGANAVGVSYTGILPDLFSEGSGVIALGRFIEGEFEASEILAKHDESYMPREVAEALKKQGVFREHVQE